MILTVVGKEELSKLLPLLLRMHMESGLELPPVDENKVLASLESCDPVIVAWEGTEPVGVLALRRSEHWFSNAEFLGDLVFYVDSAHRNSRVAYHLLTSAKQYAIMMKLPLMMAVVDANDVERKDQFFQRLGFLRAGGVYTLGL